MPPPPDHPPPDQFLRLCAEHEVTLHTFVRFMPAKSGVMLLPCTRAVLSGELHRLDDGGELRAHY